MKSEKIKEITERATKRLVAALKASYVAGFRMWNELGRFIRKGEKGIMILAPIVRRKSDGEDETEEQPASIAGFRAAYVFDVSQTDGQDLPHIGIVQGDPHAYGERLRAFASSHGIAVEYSDTIAPARGMSSGGNVTLLPGQSPAEQFSTLAHELAHELLHRGDRPISTVKTAWQAMLRRAGVTAFPIYNLRHVFCARLSEVAADAVVERAMRHTSPETKRHYQLGMAQQVRQAVEKTNKQLYGNRTPLHFRDSSPLKEVEEEIAVSK